MDDGARRPGPGSGRASAADDQHGKDGWSGLTDPAERRKRQNRLNQRAWRRRKASRSIRRLLGLETTSSEDRDQGDLPGEDPAGSFGLLVPESSSMSLDAVRECVEALGSSSSSTQARLNSQKASTHVIPPLIPYITKESNLSAFRGFSFPLSLDHRLITLIQYNVLRATVINMSIMSLLDVIPAECGVMLSLPRIYPPPKEVPPSLRATRLQQTMPHPGWIGAVPDPAMRDNLIRASGNFDEDDLCCDMIGGLYEGFDDVERRGIIVWTDPWRIDGWEVSEGFAGKWTFLLKGCAELMASTNRWRARRGEEPLVVEI